MNGIASVTGKLNVGVKTNIYFLLILIGAKSTSSKLYKRNFKKVLQFDGTYVIIYTERNEREETPMKFYSYSNNNRNYTKALSLEQVRSVSREAGSGKSAIRFSVCLVYFNGSNESFPWLEEDESRKVYEEIIKILNEKA